MLFPPGAFTRPPSPVDHPSDGFIPIRMANKTRFIDAIGFIPSELWRLIISRLAIFVTLDFDIKRPMLSRLFRCKLFE
jgi:hypothetical protein